MLDAEFVVVIVDQLAPELLLEVCVSVAMRMAVMTSNYLI